LEGIVFNPRMNSFLRKAAAFGLLLAGLASATAADVGTGSSFKGPLGLQVYSLRADFTKNVPMGLKLTKDFGFKIVELAGTYNMPAEKFKGMLDENGLQAVSGHFGFEKFRDDIEGVAKDAKTLGLKYAGCAWAPHQGDFDEAELKETIRVFNAAGAALAKHGIRFFYHCHGFEFAPADGGETYMDKLIKGTDAKNVAYEMDVFWVVHPGHDPVKWLEKYPGRWELMHVKDMRKGTESNFSGGTDVKNDVAIGTGKMDWPAILKTAQKTGVKYYFIEDESPTVKDQIPHSLEFLQSVKF
jgi:sugar phosphate isomerase/epimerase